MPSIPKPFNSFQFRVTLVLISSMFLLVLMNNVMVSRLAADAQLEQLRDKLKVIAQLSAMSIDADQLKAIPLDRTGLATPQYRTIAEGLRKIRAENPLVQYIYIMTRTRRDGIWQFIVDVNPTEKRRDGITAFPGDKYNASRFPAMMKAFEAPAADPYLSIDEWGVTLSGYAPIRDRSGQAVAVLGVDMGADDFNHIQWMIQIRTLFLMILAALLAWLMGILLSRRITGPVADLVYGTRRISRGDLFYKVPVCGPNEVAELATAFNTMSDDLQESRKKNQEYFYGVIQSLVRVVEAKDHYTRGHSERVAEYAEKIARKMNFPPDNVRIIQQAAILHDVGKLAINDSILNKTGKLTEEEWNQIKAHPVIGEDILKPVSLRPEILQIVRGHHERFDGRGYPDNLTGAETNMMAQVLSVADAYDAMTSTRAYRVALSRDQAIMELEKNRGQQFNPTVVDAFIQVLKAEGDHKA